MLPQISSQYSKQPTISLKVDGIILHFIIDTGATRDTIRSELYEGYLSECKPSVGINGVLIPTWETPPLKVTSLYGTGNILQHSFRIIPGSPVNLLGRDLLSKLESKIEVDPNGGIYMESLYCFLSAGELDYINPQVWAKDKLDIGFIPCTPYKATLKPFTNPVYQKQYPLSQEKIEGIRPIIEFFLEQGILGPVIISLKYTNKSSEEA